MWKVIIITYIIIYICLFREKGYALILRFMFCKFWWVLMSIRHMCLPFPPIDQTLLLYGILESNRTLSWQWYTLIFTQCILLRWAFLWGKGALRTISPLNPVYLETETMVWCCSATVRTYMWMAIIPRASVLVFNPKRATKVQFTVILLP